MKSGEHFTPRETGYKLMTHILFTPVKEKISKGTLFNSTDPDLW
jgi:type I restriction-modification system DNA methylase subunit